MKRVMKLVGWHWHFVRFPFALLCGLYGVQQILLLLLSASNTDKIGVKLADLFMNCGQFPLFFFVLYLVLLVSASANQNRGRSHTTYTLYTMPFSRMVLPVAQMFLCLALLVIFAAWQVLLYAAAFVPVSMLSAGTMAGVVSGNIPTGNLLDEINANPLFQLLLPVRLGSWLWLVGFFLLLSVQSACVAVCHGFRRIAAMFAAMCAVATMALRIPTPTNGYVQSVNFSPAEMVNAGTALFTLLDVSPMEVLADIPVSEYKLRNQFARYYCQVVGLDKKLPMKLLSLTPKADGNQLYQLRLTFEKQPDALTAGMNVGIGIIVTDTTSASAIAVPLCTIFRDKDTNEPCVWVFEQDSTISKRPIVLNGTDEEGRAIVIEGLTGK